MKKYLTNKKVVVAAALIAGYYIGRQYDIDLRLNAQKRNVSVLPEVNVNG